MINGRSGAQSAPGWRGRLVALSGLLALGAGLGLGAAGPAAAADVTVDGVELRWGFSNEAGSGAFFGGCNFLSAGAAGDTGSSRLWTQADGFYQTQAGNVTVVKPDAGGVYTQPTWATKCQTPAGTPVSAASTTSNSGNQVVFGNGTGHVDLAAGTASVAWDGDVTVVFYGGLTYWTASDPVLTVAADGTGTLSATASGYGADMTDTTKWVALTPTQITLANLTGVQLGEDGLTVTPDYLGVAVSTGAGTPQPAQDASNAAFWGSFPQDYVDFQVQTGQSSYWYTSGGSRDAAKPALPLAVAWDAEAPAPVSPTVSVSSTTLNSDGTSDIVVTGSGFPQASATGTPGVYVAVGPQIGAAWYTNASVFQFAKYVRPSFTGAESANGAKLEADGSFVVHFDNVLPVYTTAGGTTYDAATTPFAVLTFATQGSTDRSLDSATPLTFGDGLDVTVEVPEEPVEPEPGEFVWTIDGGSGAVSLGTAAATPTGFAAAGALRTITVTDTRAEAPAWSISGQVGNFTTAAGTTSFGGQALGWAPAVSANTVGAVAGTTVTPGTGASDGLKTSRTLASSPQGHPAGTVTVDSTLSLLAPADTAPGAYTATLTLTALS
ncbi:hypothetical protein [Cellulomonas hominis]